MWNRNALTERLQLDWPIIQSPMGEITTPSLAAAVSNAGGLGGLGMWGFDGEEAERRIAGFRQQSGGSLNVNYPLWRHPGDVKNVGTEMRARLQVLYDEYGLGAVPDAAASSGQVSADHLAMLQKMKPEVVSFHFGLPEQDTIDAIKQVGTFIVSSATTVREAKTLEARGVDAVIAQGIEAGGHRGTFSDVDIAAQPGLFALLPQVVDAVDIPVIAAGGIASGRAIAAALMLGASAVQVGTAFLGCEEANVSPAHRDALRTADDSSTVVTSVVSGRPARLVKNRLIETLSHGGIVPLPFPAQLSLTAPLKQTGSRDCESLYAGQSVAMTREMPAAWLVETLIEEAQACFARFET